MRYLIIGTGGTGGAIGGFLACNGQDVTFIARGEHRAAMHAHGLRLHTTLRGELWVEHPRVMEAAEYHETPDVAFVCVKGYSLADAQELLARVASAQTLVIPILNIYGTGEEMQRQNPRLHTLDGCVYIVSYRSAPGEITQRGPVFRVVYGERDGACPPILDAVAADLRSAGISTVVSRDIRRDCFQKFACVSPMASAGAYYDADMGQLRSDEIMRADYFALTSELDALAAAMGIPFTVDVAAKNAAMLASYTPDTTSSMQKDLQQGGRSEMDGLVFEPIRLGRRYGVPTPTYERIASKFGFSG